MAIQFTSRGFFSRTFIGLLIIIALAILSAGKLLVISEKVSEADLCLALSGSKYRLTLIIEIHKKQLCGKVFIVGGKEGNAISYAAKMAEFAQKAGIPASDIIIDETNIYSTHAELVRLRTLIDLEYERPLTVTVVTSGYHTRRTKIVWGWLFDNSINLNLIRASHKLHSVDSWLWWKSPIPRKLVLGEYTRIVFYIFRYRIPILALNNYLARFDRIND